MGLYKKTWNFACTCENDGTHGIMLGKENCDFLENDIYTCAELVKTYKNRYVKMLVLLQGNKWVPKYAHK